MKTANEQAESAKSELAETDTRYSVHIQQLENEICTATNAISQAEAALGQADDY